MTKEKNMLMLWMAIACGGGESISQNGDPNVPPENGGNVQGPPGEPSGQGAPQGGPPPNQDGQPSNQGENQAGGKNKDGKQPPTFIFNAQSDGKGPLYKSKDGGCFVRTNWDQPPNGEMGPTEEIECPSQMSQDGWANCISGRLVRHNTGEKEGTCECQPIEGGTPAVVDCI
jgi:hypothetical protein